LFYLSLGRTQDSSSHLRFHFERLAIHDHRSIPLMMNRPLIFLAGSLHAFTTLKTIEQYFSTNSVSSTLHSKFAEHSATSGAPTISTGAGVYLEAAILTLSHPERLPTASNFSADFAIGIASMHSPVARRVAKL
jgi:hypothetical protein